MSLMILRHPRLHGVGARLLLAFGVLGVLMTLCAGIAAWRIHVIGSQFGYVLEMRLPRLSLLQEVLQAINRLNTDARDALLATDASDAGVQLARIEDGRAAIGKRIEQLQKAFEADGEGGAKAADAFNSHSSGILVELLKFSRRLKAGQRGPATETLTTTLQPKLRALSDAIAAYQAEQMQQLDAERTRVEASRREALMTLGALVLATLLLAAVLAVWITRSVTRPLARAVQMGRAIAGGDLTVRADASAGRGAPRDEAGQVLDALNDVALRLGEVVANIRTNADRVQSAALEIADGNSDLARRTASQTDALATSTTQLQHLQTAVQGNADRAQGADGMADSAASSAQRGGHEMGLVVENMKRMSGSARRITEIIGVIDGIAFQTNILALNAAVEAARAGEQGRGFAVVASEVRSLAQRSAQAAKEIEALIRESVAQVATGSDRVGSVSKQIAEIVQSAGAVSGAVREISTASREQEKGIAGLGQSIALIDRSNQANAALVQQVAQTSEGLRELADELLEKVALFRLADAATG